MFWNKNKNGGNLFEDFEDDDDEAVNNKAKNRSQGISFEGFEGDTDIKEEKKPAGTIVFGDMSGADGAAEEKAAEVIIPAAPVPAPAEVTESVETAENASEDSFADNKKYEDFDDDEDDNEVPEEVSQAEETGEADGEDDEDDEEDDEDDDERFSDDPRTRRIIKIALVCAIAAVCVVAAGIMILFNNKPSPEYQSAVALMESGSYYEAAEAFSAMGGYRDSAELSQQCRYSYADELYRAGDYALASNAFAQLGAYSDCEKRVQDCENAINDAALADAMELVRAGRYEDAIAAFTKLGNYKDAAQQIEHCRALIEEENYAALLESIAGKDPLAAIAALESANGYGDSLARIEEIKKSPEYFRAQLASHEVGDRLLFGSYEQDNDSANGAEDIEWIVLDKNENGMMLTSAYLLDARDYDSVITVVTWEHSNMRKWLNSDFYDTAFTEFEKELIALTHVSTPSNELRRIPGGNDTDDYVFLMSYEEAGALFASDEDRRGQPTVYAISRGARRGNEMHEYTEYWLRTPGWDNSYAVYVHSDGHIKNHDSWQNYDKSLGVRPCIVINF